MHRHAVHLLLAPLLIAPLLIIAASAPAAAQQGAPPHAWLFGVWTGGLFPAPSAVSAQACLAQPTVIFTRDVVLRATLIDITFTQRLVETARTNPGVTDFRLVPVPGAVAGTSQTLLGADPAKSTIGFGCETADVLHVQRRTDNEISFPGCTDFPNPLVRCPAR